MNTSSSTLDAAQVALLERIAMGVALEEVLRDIVLLIERQAPDMLCSILLLDEEDRLRCGAAPSLPPQLMEGIEGCTIGPTAGSCGAAAFTKRRVVVEDIATHPYWVGYRQLAIPHGLRSCWSTPILSPHGAVLGTFAMYYREPRAPTDVEVSWVAIATHLASIAISRERMQRELRRNETRARELARLHAVASAINKRIGRAQDLRELCELACRAAVEHELAQLAWIGFIDPVSSLVVIAQFGEVAPLPIHGADLSREIELGSFVARAIADGEPAVSGSIQEDAPAHWRAALAERGLNSCGAFPLRDEGGVVGVLALYSQQSDYFRQEEVLALTSLAADLSFAIKSARTQAQRKAMQEALAAGEALRTLILDTITHAIFFLEVEGPDRYRFVIVNRALQGMFGVETNPTGRFLHEVLPALVWEQVSLNYRSAIALRRPVSWELDWPVGGVLRRFEITISPVFDAAGKCVNFVGSTNDITARLQAEAERTRLLAQLNQAQRIQALGTLAGGIAHDFNNILAAISGNSALLLQEPDLSPEHRVHVHEIQKASRRAVELVRQILAFSRRAPPKREVVEVSEVAGEALKLLRATLPQTITIDAQIAPDAPRFEGDATQFHQVLMNLGMNAAHALPTRGGVIRVVIDGTQIQALDHAPQLTSGRYLRLQVSDNGCGMDEATLKRAFDPFFTTRKPGEGTGLGLSVVHGIVESHHGRVELRSTVGEGTLVTVYLPAANATQQREQPSLPSAGHGERIMYVDDEEALVFLMERSLTKLGYRVSGFADSTLALGAFRSRPGDFDIVITDLSMPRMSGPDLAVELRRIRPDVPIIMTSGFIRPEDVHMAQRLGVDQLVYKASTIEELGSALAREITRLEARPVRNDVANR